MSDRSRASAYDPGDPEQRAELVAAIESARERAQRPEPAAAGEQMSLNEETMAA